MKRWRTILKRTILGIAFLLLAGSLLLGFLVRRPPRLVVAEIESQIAAAIHAAQPPHVRIGRLRVDLSAPAVLAEDVAISARRGVQPAVRMESARIDIKVHWSLQPRIEVTRVTLVRPVVNWSEEIGLLLVKGPAESEETTSYPALRIVGGSVEGVFPDVGWIQASEVELEAGPEDIEGRYGARLSLRVPSAGRIVATGAIQPATETYELYVEGQALNPDPKDLPWLSTRARSFMGDYEPRGKIDLHGYMKGSFHGTPELSLALGFHEFSARVPQIGEHVHSAAGLLRIDPAGNAHLRARASIRNAAIEIEGFGSDLMTSEPEVSVAVITPEVLSYEPWVRDLLPAIDGPQIELDAFSAAGKARLQLFLEKRRNVAAVIASAEIEVIDARASYVGFPRDTVAFPYPIEALHGRVSYRYGTLIAPGLEGRSPTGAIDLEGIFRFAAGQSPGLDFVAQLDGARIDEDLDRGVRGLPEVGVIWSDLEPHGGRLDALIRISKTRGEPRLQILGEVEVHNAEARYREFPMQTGELHGSIGLAEAGVSFRFQGVADPRGASRAPFDLAGAISRFPIGEMGRAGFGLKVHARGMRYGSALKDALRALDAETAETLNEFHYDGQLDIHAHVLRSAGAAHAGLDSQLEIALVGGALTRVGLGSSLRESNGLLLVETKAANGNQALDASVHGWVDGRVASDREEVSAAGTADGFADGLLVLEARTHPLGLDIDLQADISGGQPEKLRQAVDTIASTKLLEELRFEGGEIDADLNLLHRATQKPELSAELDLHDVKAQVADWITPLNHVRGQISVLPYGQMRATELAFEVAHAEGEESTQVELRDVSLETTSNGLQASARTRVQNLALDRHLEIFLGKSASARLLQWKGSGRAKSADLEVNLSFARQMDGTLAAPRVDFKGPVLLEDVNLDPGIAVQGIGAEFDIVRGRVGVQGVEAIEAEVKRGRMRVLGITFEDMGTRLRLDPSGFRTLRRVSGAVLGGRLAALANDGDEEPQSFALNTRKEGPLIQLNLRIEDAALDRLLSEIQSEPVRAPGRFDAQLEIAGPVENLGLLTGTSTLVLRDGELGKLPVLGRLNPLLGQEAVTFRTARALARLDGLIVRVDQLQLESDAATLSGTGAIGLDGSLALAIDITYLDVLGIPIFGSIVARGLGMILASAPLVHLEVAGWIDDPRIYPQFGPTGRRGLRLTPRPYLPLRIRPSFPKRF